MNRETFLNELMAGLTQLGPVEQRQVADYYNELIFDGVENGKPEEEIIAGFGAPEEIAAQIRAEYKSQQAVEGRPGRARYRLVRHVWSTASIVRVGIYLIVNVIIIAISFTGI